LGEIVGSACLIQTADMYSIHYVGATTRVTSTKGSIDVIELAKTIAGVVGGNCRFVPKTPA
jgi:hypothetical protein